MVIMAILYCSPYASLATSNTSKGYFHTVPGSRRLQEAPRRFKTLPRGFKTHLIWLQDGLTRTKTHKTLRDASKTLQDEQYRPISTNIDNKCEPRSSFQHGDKICTKNSRFCYQFQETQQGAICTKRGFGTYSHF